MMMWSQALCCLLLAAVSWMAAFQLSPGAAVFAPASWAVLSSCIWLLYGCLASTGLRPPQRAAVLSSVLLGVGCACAFLLFLSQDRTFRSWADVYYFCGSRMQFCNCNLRWNLLGWCKACILWAFVLSSALGLQRLVIHLGLCGLLPGEEVVTRESFISMGWRLIPYSFNKWEQHWGSETSSMMFELLHFAIELTVVLPCVQILCGRMKVLAMPSVNAALPPGRDEAPDVVRRDYVPNVLRGCWERQPDQARLLQRIRANKRIICFSFGLCLMASLNSLVVPLSLEAGVLAHPLTPAMQLIGRIPRSAVHLPLAELRRRLAAGELSLRPSFVLTDAANAAAGEAAAATYFNLAQLQGLGAAGEAFGRALFPESAINGTLHDRAVAGMAAAMAAAKARVRAVLAPMEAGPWQGDSSYVDAALGVLQARADAFEARGCSSAALAASYRKHHEETHRMQDPRHRATTPLIEAALTLMRLATEKFFVLLALHVAFILFRQPPRPAAALVGLVGRVSAVFARTILLCFPAVCWAYGAGFLFSFFCSVVFWGGPLLRLAELLRSSFSRTRIKCLRPATAAEIERMGGDCAICWGEMTLAGAAPAGGGSTTTAADELARLQQPAPAAAAAAAGGSSLSDGCSLSCGHSYHRQCVSEWLQQCHNQGVAATCPMCQHPLQLQVTWHWPRPDRDAAARAAGAAAAVGGEGAHNNYLLEHQPRLAELLADMPAILAPEHIQLLAEVQDLRHQRQLLLGELQLRQQQLQALIGRQQAGLEVEQQRQQLEGELQLLRRARDRQRQLRRLRQAWLAGQQQQQQVAAAGDVQAERQPFAARPPEQQQQPPPFGGVAGRLDGAEDFGERFRQLEQLLDAFIWEQEQAACQPPSAASAGKASSSSKQQAAQTAAAAQPAGGSSRAAAAGEASRGCPSSIAGESSQPSQGWQVAQQEAQQQQQQQLEAPVADAAAAAAAQPRFRGLRLRR